MKPETWKIVLLVPVIVGLFAVEQHLKNGFHAPPYRERNLALGEVHARELLRLMDADGTGKVSRQEFMAFMDAEYNRLGKNKTRELDAKDPTQSKLPPGPNALTVSAKTASR